ncbi:GntR family transcriptional regulator [Methylobacterium sp. R2-1]|uniref:GntR family transcriptional regulator n=1 Tax=Methylobacterium sp. R2-1 TaxID=2587064 RepID=UPI0016165E35|nr:GntR family transcriptional regulator [Methylobacterium sp. R2-1]MBB2965163.1 hypothetical protein [Methylobacterium sp. R2-1]
MFADHLRTAIEAAPRITLPAITAQLWRAYGEGHVTEAEAEALSALIEARQGASPKAADQITTGQIIFAVDRENRPRRAVGSRPRTDASLERRRRWAASGRLPPSLAARFTLAEQAVLALVAAETCRRKDCRLAVGNLAAIAGVSETTVRNAIREAVRHGLLTVEERKITGWRNDTNVVRIVAPEWLSWLRLNRKRKDEALAVATEGRGCKSSKGTPTEVLTLWNSRSAAPPQRLPNGSGRPDRKRAKRNCGDR